MQLKIGIIREGKSPPDARVPLIPVQCERLNRFSELSIKVQPSPIRCFTDEEYQRCNVPLSEDLSDCDILLGVKEVPPNHLIANKTYCFFSHTIKAQPHNRGLLQTILDKNITLMDYELMVDRQDQRVIAFGFFAGMVGAHNALYTFGKRTSTFDLPRLYTLSNYDAVFPFYEALQLPPLKIVVTGTGRVGQGAQKTLIDMGFVEVSPKDFLNESFHYPIFTTLRSSDYVRSNLERPFNITDYYRDPTNYAMEFIPFYQTADIFINCIFWDNRAPVFFTQQEMASEDFKIQVIADVTCDIAPMSSIPSTLRASTIKDPVYGFNPQTGKEIPPFQSDGIDIMAVDNLPGEIPRDASESFGNQIIAHLIPALLDQKKDLFIQKATIAKQGQLNPIYPHLIPYIQGLKDPS